MSLVRGDQFALSGAHYTHLAFEHGGLHVSIFLGRDRKDSPHGGGLDAIGDDREAAVRWLSRKRERYPAAVKCEAPVRPIDLSQAHVAVRAQAHIDVWIQHKAGSTGGDLDALTLTQQRALLHSIHPGCTVDARVS